MESSISLITPHSLTTQLAHVRTGQTARLYTRIQRKLRRKAVHRRLVRISFVALNALLLIAVLVFVFNANSTGANKTGSVQAATGVLSNTDNQQTVGPLDQLSSVDIAQTASVMAGLPETSLINGQVVAESNHLKTAPLNSSYVDKPQVVATKFKSNKDIHVYVAQSGDSVDSIASKFGISADSVRWSNGLFGNSVTIGAKLFIPPVDGIVYTVKAGDTPQSLGQSYATSDSLITAYNDAELTGLQVGEQIIIPGGKKPAPTYSGYSYGLSYGVAGNYSLYAKWNCTWWVAYRWAQVGYPIMPLLHNASEWYYSAQSAGLKTGIGLSGVRQYAAAVTNFAGYGHVVFVESVNRDDAGNIVSIKTSEMNVSGANTYYPRDPTVTYQTVSAAEAAHYYYIYP